MWASNRERDAFLDWFADHRCAPGDERWEFCKSEGNRWPGSGINLSELIPRGERFEVTAAEQAAAGKTYWPEVAQLLGIVSQISCGEWKHLVSSKEAVHWRVDDIEREARWQREQDELSGEPFRTSSFGPDGQVKFLPPDDEAASEG
ncbi:MAG TPA: hypothetical protein VGR35_07590 [Tepidisphaeraceae bacterium]|nr:hypothetical protein [Tepidisphaeraceae bacterium]